MADAPFTGDNDHSRVLVPDAAGLVPPTALAAGATVRIVLPLVPEWAVLENIEDAGGEGLYWALTKAAAEAGAGEPYQSLRADREHPLPCLESVQTYWVHNPSGNSGAVSMQFRCKFTRKRYSTQPACTVANGFPEYVSETLESETTIQPGVEAP